MRFEQDKSDVQTLLERIESLNELKGVLRTQKENIVTLNRQAQILEDKIKDLKVTESECKILELMNSFYSPTGFKIYELKKRCQKLIFVSSPMCEQSSMMTSNPCGACSAQILSKKFVSS